ncbi:MAG: S41 family peptidase [Planctomycetota bacterium]
MTVLSLLFVLLTPVLPVQGGVEDAKATVQEIVAKAEGADEKQLWTIADELIVIGKAKAERDAIRNSLKNASPRATLVLSRALLQIEKGTYTEDVAASLLKIIEANTPEAAAAAGLLRTKLVVLEREDQAKIAAQLDDFIVKGTTGSEARIEVALALWKLGNGEQKVRAIKEMKNYYKADDPLRKAAGALALAQCEDVEFVRPYLQKLQYEPTDRGRLAFALLQNDDDHRTYSEKLRKAQVAVPDEVIKSDAPSGGQPPRETEGERFTSDSPKLLTDTLTLKTLPPIKSGERISGDDPRLLNEVLAMIDELHLQGNEWKREELLAAAARGMLNELDPHSTFFTAAEYAKMIQDLKQVYAGIGAQVRTIEGAFTIVRPFFSGPAYKAGIRAGDRVMAIISNGANGVEGEWTTLGQPDDEIIKKLKGSPGTSIKLKIFRRGWVEPKTYPVTRELIQIPLLESEILPGGIAYFDLLQFGEEVARQLAIDLKKMAASGELKGVVLDLRNNPGGLLEAAIDLCSVFLPKGKLVCYTEGRKTKRRDFYTHGRPAIPSDVPVVVLINNYSASASEIVAGCLQDHGRATIVGEPSFGKGSVQQMFVLPSLKDEDFIDQDRNGLYDSWEEFTDSNNNGKFDPGPRVKITIERYLLPKGRNINTEYDPKTRRRIKAGGVIPDLTVDWPLLDLGREAEMQRIGADEKVANYVRDQFAKNPELFRTLAAGDGKQWNKYPEFEEFYKSLNTWIDRNDVRRLLRWKIRDTVAEDRGKMFPGGGSQGDIEEDPQLRQAIAKILDQLQIPFDSISQFGELLKREKEIGVNLGPKPEEELKAVAAAKAESRPAR